MARIHLFPNEAPVENVLTPPGAPTPVGGPINGPSMGPTSAPATPRQPRGMTGPRGPKIPAGMPPGIPAGGRRNKGGIPGTGNL